ncbi:hypothetical protein AGR3A_Cc120098 [Agrobacterium tomkonis CFBP 6623]|uniref:Uncharacterized protein n=1 Tax=Agrobacterium tomkonis CFBP 6623 TaxID=1183432 RepID=A0A1S7NNH7_9HYPH|nr:hypothetical protein AGR3A_Cc120098 [Agrobacterium tomkonis CFBP 6623]
MQVVLAVSQENCNANRAATNQAVVKIPEGQIPMHGPAGRKTGTTRTFRVVASPERPHRR